MLTASDIQKKEFEKSFRGYREVEVDAFLEEIKSDYEMMSRENSELKNRINMLNDKINYYSTIEDTLQKTLVVAQTTAEEVIISARKNSDMILDDAEDKADKIIESAEIKTEKIIDSARNQVIQSKEEYENIRKEMHMFKIKYKTMLNAQFDCIEYYSDKGSVFDESDSSDEENDRDAVNRNLQWTGKVSEEELEIEKNLHLDK